MNTPKNDVTHLFRLISVPGIGNQRIRQLVAHFGSVEAVLSASFSDLIRVEGVDKILAEKIRHHQNDAFVRSQLARAEKEQATLLRFWDPEYPEALKTTFDPPVLLYLKGKLLPEDAISLAVVGTRNPSPYGAQVTEQLTRELVRTGFVIVSGLARGVDTLAHRTALKSGGRTLAVLGTGLDVLYPSENRRLAEQIEAEGALVTEFPFGTRPDASNFPKRNRIISGLTLGTLVIEAGQKSGALITAAFALEQGREVFAVPGPITSPRSAGTNRLIREGARLVQTVDDILEELEPRLRSLRKMELGHPATPELHLSGNEKRLFDALTAEPQHIDVLSQKVGLSSSEALSLLLSLELKDLVKQLPGAYFVRAF